MYIFNRTVCALVVTCLFSMLLVASCYADSSIVQFTQGTSSTFVLYDDGSIASTGNNFQGRMGDGTDIERRVLGPVLVNNACKVYAGDAGIALKRDGTVWTWGSNRNGVRGYETSDYLNPAPVPNMTGVKDIACSAGSCFAIKDDGTIWAWGINYHGSLGIGEAGGVSDKRINPVQVKGLPNNIVSISASMVNAFALDDQGHVWAWGKNDVGQLGDGSTDDRTTPVRLPIDHVKQISAGGYTTMAVKGDGTIWAWGRDSDGDSSGRLGGASTAPYSCTPVQVPGLTEVTSIVTGDNTMALKRDGTVWAWGIQQGILGNGQYGDSSLKTPTKVNVQDAIAISNQGGSYIIQKRDGSLWAWGANTNGELGLGYYDNNIERGTPVLTPSKVLSIGASPLPDQRRTPTQPNPGTPGGSAVDNQQNNTTVTPTQVATPNPISTMIPTSNTSTNIAATPQQGITVTPAITTVTTTPTPVHLPSIPTNQAPGFGLNTFALLGCLLVLTGLLSGVVRRNGR